VTDRRQLAVAALDQKTALLEKIKEIAEAGVDWIQIRERDLSARELSELVGEAIRSVPVSCRILVNDRLDVACARRAAGVHLRETSISVEDARRFVRECGPKHDFLVGVSVHSEQAARAAEAAGADYVLFGPVFETPSKAALGAPQGTAQLGAVCSDLSIPVLGIGGITPENVRECYERGVSGVAAIRSFQEARDISRMVRQLHGSFA
jgi:thiamine-phosphate pyrophosphorylase